ncbi:MAG: alpha/beta fold hydrolase, partial [Gammaproteobacteria bacterium]|nr:alpha/beta fold hydrolase [Gammaproteobacteria bacterium]
ATSILNGPAVWIGWSLGALPVVELARQFPHLVSKVVLIASNPCFVTRDDWEFAVEESVFDLFAENLQQNIEKTLQRFLSLQVQGLEQSREVLRLLRSAIKKQGLPAPAALDAGLNILKTTDLRDQLAQLTMPQYWLLGDRDTLVPASLNDYLSVQPGIKSHIISGSAHLPFISHTEEVMQQFLAYIDLESTND